MYNIISEAIFEGNEKAAITAGYIDLGILVNDAFSCEEGFTCCDKTGIFIKKAYLVKSRKKPKNNFISLEKIIKNIYNCCEDTSLCLNTSAPTYWISSEVIRPKKTIETISFDKVIKKAFKCCGLTECGCGVTTYNFDLEMDWSILLDNNGASYPVTDQVTFEQWLTNGADAHNDYYNTSTNIVITDFLMTRYRIQCNLTMDATDLVLSNNNIINANKLGILNGLSNLYLYNNQIVVFNPSIVLPTNLVYFPLNGNQMTTSSYTAMEAWANAQPAFTTTCTIDFSNNIDSVSGTNLETILISKNCNVLA